MKKVSIFILVLISIFFISCGNEAESDNDSGITDNKTTIDDVQENDDSQDETTDELTDETTDEIADEATDEAELPDESTETATPEALSCCQGIVKEWFRCEGSFVFDAVEDCVNCVNALESCEKFNPLDDGFSCKTECNAVWWCVALKGDDSGTDRRLIADEYCLFIMSPNCALRTTDFSNLGDVEGLDACYDL